MGQDTVKSAMLQFSDARLGGILHPVRIYDGLKYSVKSQTSSCFQSISHLAKTATRSVGLYPESSWRSSAYAFLRRASYLF